MSNYLRILKKYGILVEDNEGWVEELERIPNRKKGETFKQWKVRTFGENVEGLKVYVPCDLAPQKKMVTLANDSGSDYLIWAFRHYREMAEDDAAVALEEAKEEIVNKLTTVPKSVLKEIIKENDEELEQSALDFLERYIKANESNISTREILTDLIRTYSKVVSQFRSKENS